MTKQDIKRTAARRDEYGPNQELPPSGTYRLVIAKGAGQDVLKASDPTGFTTAQDITVDGQQIRLTSYVDPTVGAFCGPEIPAQAQYAFASTGPARAQSGPGRSLRRPRLDPHRHLAPGLTTNPL